MLSLHEFNALSNVDKSDYLRESFPVNSVSRIRRKSVHGIGINDAAYVTQPEIEGKRVRCPAYVAWASMLMRAYCPKYQAKRPTYAGVTVCDDWLSFSAFRFWWLANQVDDRELDKDLLGDFREYGPESCIFVPKWLNSFTVGHGAARGSCPIGASWHKDNSKYRATCSHPFGKTEHLGHFTSADDAHDAWLSRKLEIAGELKHLMDEIDPRIYPRVVEIISRAK